MSSSSGDVTRRQVYDSERSHLLKALQSSYEHFDKAILTLSVAALGFSMSFIKDIVPIEHLVGLSLLIVSWCAFASAILITVVSFILSSHAINTQLDYAEKYYIQGENRYGEKKNPFSRLTAICNYLSGTSFLLGLILTIIFASANITKENSAMADQDEIKKRPIREGFVPGKLSSLPDEGDPATKGSVPAKMPKVTPAPKDGDTKKESDVKE
jgi:hypothetical protein